MLPDHDVSAYCGVCDFVAVIAKGTRPCFVKVNLVNRLGRHAWFFLNLYFRIYNMACKVSINKRVWSYIMMSDSLSKVLFEGVENADTDSFRQEKEMKMNPHKFINGLLMVHLSPNGNYVGFVVKDFKVEIKKTGWNS